MKTNNKLALMMAMMSISAVKYNKNSFIDVDFEDDLKEPETEKERAIRLGLKEWNINGKIVYSATKKKAIKLSLKNKNN